MEWMEQRGLKCTHIWARKCRNGLKSTFHYSRPQLITRRSQVQVLSPQPKSHRFLQEAVTFFIFCGSLCGRDFPDPNRDPYGESFRKN